MPENNTWNLKMDNLIRIISIILLSAYITNVNAVGLSNFAVSSGTYDETTTLAQLQIAVENEFGANYRVAKWSDLLAYHDSGNLYVDFNTEFGGDLSVTRNGLRFYSSTQTYYIRFTDISIDGATAQLSAGPGHKNTLVYTDTPLYALESPSDGDLRSGVGVIRGWACDANTVDVSINNGDKIQVVYGNSRKDTEGVCGDSNNGFELLVNWALIGAGEHTIKLYLDDMLKSTVIFNVGVLDDNSSYVRGLSKTYNLPNFPVPGEATTIEWSEADQNFLIIESH